MRLCLFLLPLLALTSDAAFAQNYTFLRVAGEATPRPDGLGPIAVNVSTRPALEGNYVVFRDGGFFGSNGLQTIWSVNLVDASINKLVDLSTAAPGGTGNFSDLFFDSSPILKNGVVTFLARDSKALPANQGIYTVSVNGGPITRVVNYNSADPSGGNFRIFDTASKPFGGFTADQKVAFNGNNDANVTGVYSANPDGSAITRIADAANPVRPNSGAPVSIFYNPWIIGNTVLFYGQTVFDPSTGFHAIYSSPATGPTGRLADGSPNYVEVVNSDTPLPGNSNSRGHTRFNPGLALEGGTVAFVADDSNSNYRGIFTVPAGGGTLTRVVAPGVALPGISELSPVPSFGSFAMNQGRILFRAVGTTNGATIYGLYLWENGTITRILQTGDMLDGRRVNEIFDVGTHALNGNKMVILLSLIGYGGAIYVAQPADPAVQISAVANAANYSTQAISPGEIVSVFGSNLGPVNLTAFQLNAQGRLANSIANARFLINGNPAPPIYVRNDQASAIVPFGLNEENASVVAVYNGNASARFTIPVAATTAGLFSSDSTGTGQGAILNQDGSVNSAPNPAAKGSTVVLFGTGHGATNPALVAGQVTPSVNIPNLFTQTTVTIGGQTARIGYAGPAPGLVAGVLQINAVIPDGVSSGNLPVVVRFGSDSSQANLTVAVQ